MSAHVWLAAIAPARGAYDVFRKCIPLPSFDEFSVAAINELRYERERELVGDAGRFGRPVLDQCVHRGRGVALVRIAHVQHLPITQTELCVTIRVVCADGRIAEVSREDALSGDSKEDRPKRGEERRPAVLGYGLCENQI
jgi:hypothetical protein